MRTQNYHNTEQCKRYHGIDGSEKSSVQNFVSYTRQTTANGLVLRRVGRNQLGMENCVEKALVEMFFWVADTRKF